MFASSASRIGRASALGSLNSTAIPSGFAATFDFSSCVCKLMSQHFRSAVDRIHAQVLAGVLDTPLDHREKLNFRAADEVDVELELAGVRVGAPPRLRKAEERRRQAKLAIASHPSLTLTKILREAMTYITARPIGEAPTGRLDCLQELLAEELETSGPACVARLADVPADQEPSPSGRPTAAISPLFAWAALTPEPAFRSIGAGANRRASINRRSRADRSAQSSSAPECPVPGSIPGATSISSIPLLGETEHATLGHVENTLATDAAERPL